MRAIYLLKEIAKRFVRRQEEWSIGIYSGNSPLNLKPHPQAVNPVLTAKNVTDIKAEFVADPFMIFEDGLWYMFFEVLDLQDNRGKIALATSQDGISWTYRKLVLQEPFHLSYPYVFRWNGDYYMIPETYQANSIRLYKAMNFPNQWECINVLLDGRSYVDATLFRYHQRWWMFSCAQEGNDTLFIHSSDSLTGSWVEHPQSPVLKGNAQNSRPAGRVTSFDGRLYRYAQDCQESYGKQVNAFEITELTTTNYQERAVVGNPVLRPRRHTWRSTGIHTVDPHKLKENHWIACVDGKRNALVVNS